MSDERSKPQDVALAPARPHTEVELAVFIEDITLPLPKHVYWGRLLGEIDPSSNSEFELFGVSGLR